MLLTPLLSLALLAQSGTVPEISHHPPIENRASSLDLDQARAKIAEWQAYAQALQIQLNSLAQKFGQCSISLAVAEGGKIPPHARAAPRTFHTQMIGTNCAQEYNHPMKHLRLIPLMLIFAIPCHMFSAQVKSGNTTCPTSGLKQLKTTSTRAAWIGLQAPSTNTGVVVFGDTTITAVANCGATVGNCLTPTGTSFLPTLGNSQPYDLSATWIVCSVSADSISYNYLQ